MAVALDLQGQGAGQLALVMEATALTTCLSLAPHPPSILLSVALDCTLLRLSAPLSPLEAQGPPNTCPPFSLLLLCPHHKVSLIHGKHRANPTTQHHPSQKRTTECWEFSNPKTMKRMRTISSSTIYYMPRAQLPILPSITPLLSSYHSRSPKLETGKARG